MNMKEEHRKILDDKVQDIILRTMHLPDVMAVCKEVCRRNAITWRIERREAEYSAMVEKCIYGYYRYTNEEGHVIITRAGLKLKEQEENLAHELGHYFTHRLNIFEGYTTKEEVKLEEEKADYFMEQIQVWFAFRDLLKKRKEMEEKVLKKVV